MMGGFGGPRLPAAAYFLSDQKVSKKSLKPTDFKLPLMSSHIMFEGGVF
jgi:hypothetical protein